MNIHTKLISLFSILLIIVVFASCKKDFEEIDTNPLGFTKASDGSLFNGVIQSVLLSGNEQFYVNNENPLQTN